MADKLAEMEAKARQFSKKLQEARRLTGGDSSAYDRQKERSRQRSEDEARAGRDIGELPKVKNAKRKARSAKSFRTFCETYFPHNFRLKWSTDHLKVIDKIETAVLRGGLFAVAMPRGAGKTTLAECACLWAIINGHRQFCVFIGATADAAARSLKVIRAELETNDLLAEDFPEVCYPIHRLEGITQRRLLYQDEPLRIVLTGKQITLPWVKRSKAAGATLVAVGITASFRGMKLKRPDGESLRPDLVIPDDVQSDKTAKSASLRDQCLQTLAGAILGLAGPGKKISGLTCCTVIRPGDVADQILDRKKHPEWNGERCKMVYSFPANEKLWEEYREIRDEGLRNGDGGQAGNRFYGTRRDEMDAGAAVAWPERFRPDELSAIQHAMNLRFFDERAFFAEYQNEPLPEDKPDQEELTADQIAERVNRQKRYQPSAATTQLTAFIDVQATLLFYVVCAWEPKFGGTVIDYGTWPDQDRYYFTLRDSKKTLMQVTNADGLEASIYAGLDKLAAHVLGREYLRADGAGLRISKCMIDANWGESTKVVRRFCRQSVYASSLLASHGKGIGAAGLPMHDWPIRPGEQRGHNWRIGPDNEGGRKVVYDTNYWKSFVHARLGAPLGGAGTLTLFGDSPGRHRLLADHLTAEHRIKTEGRGRTVNEWRLVTAGRDNHWFDGLVGCAVAASIQGISLEAHGPAQGPKRRRVPLDELKRRARQKGAV